MKCNMLYCKDLKKKRKLMGQCTFVKLICHVSVINLNDCM